MRNNLTLKIWQIYQLMRSNPNWLNSRKRYSNSNQRRFCIKYSKNKIRVWNYSNIEDWNQSVNLQVFKVRMYNWRSIHNELSNKMWWLDNQLIKQQIQRSMKVRKNKWPLIDWEKCILRTIRMKRCAMEDGEEARKRRITCLMNLKRVKISWWINRSRQKTEFLLIFSQNSQIMTSNWLQSSSTKWCSKMKSTIIRHWCSPFHRKLVNWNLLLWGKGVYQMFWLLCFIYSLMKTISDFQSARCCMRRRRCSRSSHTMSFQCRNKLGPQIRTS